MANNYISKTAFLKFEQCHKAFFLYKNHYYLKDKLSVDKQLTFKRGHDVGFLAQQLFPGGINVVEKDSNKDNAIAFTKQLIENKTPVIYEATFVFNDVLVMVDILVLTENGYIAYEVKSSLKVSETYIKDACLQHYVLKNCLSDLIDFFIVTLNETYVFNGELNLKNLFKRRSVLKDASRNETYIQDQISNAKLIIERNVIPNVEIGKQCTSPYECDFFKTCWKDKITEESIFNLGKVNKDDLFTWYYNGIKNISDLQKRNDLPRHLKNQVESQVKKEAHIDVSNIKEILAQIKVPYAAIDMEIWGQAIPVIIGTKPFQKVPFLYTLFSEEGNEHFFFDYEIDDRRKFAESLITNTQKYQTLLAYDKSLENMIILELADLFKDLKNELQKVASKLFDISDIIQHHFYYHYLFKGNYSLKIVSKVILNEDLFENENIHTGLEAMNSFISYRANSNAIEKEILKSDLINYCMVDTKATFLITKKFIELTKVE